MLGSFGNVYVFPLYEVHTTMTAIAIASTAEGFAIAADGRLRFDDESREKESPQALTLETDKQQKIFPASFPQQAAAYAVSGSVFDPRGFDLPKIVDEQIDIVCARKFDVFSSCLKALGEEINRAINDAKRTGTFEAFPRIKKMDRSHAWIIASIYFCGYFNHFPCISQMDFFHFDGDADFQVNEKSLDVPLVSGSEIVAHHMYCDPRDPRFSTFVLQRGQSPSLQNAKQVVRGYIEACSSPLGLELDEPICKGIGGHIHMATITKSAGFTWVIEPIPYKH
jgi:hypothetical protein